MIKITKDADLSKLKVGDWVELTLPPRFIQMIDIENGNVKHINPTIEGECMLIEIDGNKLLDNK